MKRIKTIAGLAMISFFSAFVFWFLIRAVNGQAPGLIASIVFWIVCFVALLFFNGTPNIEERPVGKTG